MTDASTTANAVELEAVEKRFGAFVAVQKTDLAVPEGSFVTLLGPSGCGKTTTLRMIAGLLDPTEGDIRVKGRSVTSVPIHKRNLGLVFQNYALFPHKSVFDNVAFGLKYRDVPKAEVTKRVREALALVQLPHVEDRRPIQLSGGQQQRIGLARAIVIQPDVLLLDEPLSALDANLREEMRVELKRIQRELGIATVFVTHDQSEALAMSDSLVVMNQGWVEQVGPPDLVYNEPASQFVADFLGHSNILPGRVAGEDGGFVKVITDAGATILCHTRDRAGRPQGERVRLVLRAERLLLGESHDPAPGHSLMRARVRTVDYLGQSARYFLTTIGDDGDPGAGVDLQAINPIDRAPFPEGAEVWIRVRGDDCVLLDGDSDA
jgi:putative spermidine/putrescine transport system ATP-binding protein/spermidine/putrescine transport system ATP-binding protein